MVLVSLTSPTAPGGCLWTLAIAAAQPRNLFLPAPPFRACIFHSLRTRCVMAARSRSKPMTRISCNINAVTRCPGLNRHCFLVHLSLRGPLRRGNRTASVKVVSPLRLVSCPSTIPTCSLVLLPMGFRSFPPRYRHVALFAQWDADADVRATSPSTPKLRP